jgi:hypothetical protein
MTPSRDSHRRNYSFIHRIEALINERLNWMEHKQMPLPNDVQFVVWVEWNHDTRHADVKTMFWGETDQGQVATAPSWSDVLKFDRDAAHFLVDQSMATMMAAREVLNNEPITQGA